MQGIVVRALIAVSPTDYLVCKEHRMRGYRPRSFGWLATVFMVATTLTGVPALALEVKDDPDPVRIGDKATYTITITNAYPHNTPNFFHPPSNRSGSV